MDLDTALSVTMMARVIRSLALYQTIPPNLRPALMVADGVGVDSTALLLGLYRRGIRPDAILHADTGDEHPETVSYRDERRRWLREVGFPDLTVVRRAPSKPGRGRARKDGREGTSYSTLGENCLANNTLPSLAFGFKACSVKWKVEPQNAWARRWAPALRTWARGQKVVKLIGYDAGPRDMRRAHELPSDGRYTYLYPLRDEWIWDREKCISEILRAGLPLPRKSACFYCPASKPHEVAELVVHHPSLADAVVRMEDNARPYLTSIEGLWRTSVKGRRRGSVARPGSMADFIRELRANPTTLARYLVPPSPVPTQRRLPMYIG